MNTVNGEYEHSTSSGTGNVWVDSPGAKALEQAALNASTLDGQDDLVDILGILVKESFEELEVGSGMVHVTIECARVDEIGPGVNGSSIEQRMAFVKAQPGAAKHIQKRRLT